MGLKEKLHNFKEKNKDKKWLPAFAAFHTFLYTPNETTHSGGHVRSADDLKRTMNMVVLAMIPCLIFGMFNTGYQHYLAFGEAVDFLSWDAFLVGLTKILPLVVVSYAVGLGVEFIFAIVKGHEVEEGYLVTGMLVPLIVPVDIPLWMLSVAVIFGVVIGKEVFGGTGMNILNPALTIRAFLFFAYPTWMSGDKVWVHGATQRASDIIGGANLDAVSGETVLGGLAQGHELAYSVSDMFFGFIPGSVGETSTLLILLAGLFLVFTKIASWRIMLSSVVGALIMGLLFNGVVNAGWIAESSKFYALMSTEFWHHLLIGGFAFGVVFMATDPVTGSQTNRGKWIYGFLIGFISIMIRVFNPAYPEGVMLAILLMNVFAPTIDHYVVQGNVKRRLKRLKAKNSITMAKNTDSNVYTILFATGMVLVVGTLLAFLASSLKDKIAENKRIEKQQNILYAMGINDNDESSVEFVSKNIVGEEFNKYITKQLVIKGVDATENNDAYLIDIKKEEALAKDKNYQRRLPLFIGNKEGEEFYIVPVRGKGLWDAIWGYVALDNQLVVQGVFFDHAGETPGLGSNIKERFFMDDFIGEHILDGDTFKGITAAKGNADPKNMNKTDFEVDAIAGATITGDGLSAMLKKDLKMYLPYLKTLKQ